VIPHFTAFSVRQTPKQPERGGFAVFFDSAAHREQPELSHPAAPATAKGPDFCPLIPFTHSSIESKSEEKIFGKNSLDDFLSTLLESSAGSKSEVFRQRVIPAVDHQGLMNRRPCSEAPERSQKGQEPTIRCAVLDEDKTQTELVAKLLSDAGHNCELFRQGRTLLNR
jgi:hypothetical protein